MENLKTKIEIEIDVLKEIENVFSIYSDMSSKCLGYKRLREIITEKEKIFEAQAESPRVRENEQVKEDLICCNCNSKIMSKALYYYCHGCTCYGKIKSD